MLDNRRSNTAVSPWLLRVIWLLLSMGALYLAVIWEVKNPAPGQALFSEQSPLEASQVIVLAICFVMALLAKTPQADNPERWLLAGLFASMVVRELDFWLEDMAFSGLWQILVSLILIASISMTWPHRAQLRASLPRLFNSLSWGIFISGCIVTVFSRFFGKSYFWMEIMGRNYQRSVKNAGEEVTESLAFTLFVVAMFEYLLLMRGSGSKTDD